MKKKRTKLYLFNEYATRERLEGIKELLDILPDPDQILEDNEYDYGIYRNLLTDPHLMAAIQQRKQQILQMDYEIESNGNEEKIKQIKEIINNLPIQTILSDILDCIFFGYSVQEVIYDYINNQIIPIDLIYKPQEWFIFNQKNELMIRRYENGSYIFQEGETLPPLKFIVNQYNPTYDNPYGEKILSRCYWPITFKRTTIEFWQTMVEKFGMPYLIGYYATGATIQEQEELLDQLEELQKNNIGVLDTKFYGQIEIKESPKYDIGQLYELLVKFHNTEIAKAVLTVTLTIDIGATGSYKLGEVHKQMLEYIGLTDKKIAEAGINKLLEYWNYLNYGIIEDTPKFKLKKKEEIIASSAKRDETLRKMGIKFTDKYYQKRYNLSREDFTMEKTNKKME